MTCVPIRIGPDEPAGFGRGHRVYKVKALSVLRLIVVVSCARLALMTETLPCSSFTKTPRTMDRHSGVY